MQDLLTASVVIIAVLFIVSVIADFATGLVKLWQDAGSKAQQRVEAKPLTLQPIEADPWMLPVEEAAALPDEQPIITRQMLLPPARQQVATLQWVLRNLPPAETFIVELPDAIAMAKSRLAKAAPVLDLATKAELAAIGIRRCKKLASQLGVRGYGNLKLSQLVERLEGRVLQSQLVA